MSANDHELLGQFARNQSQDAFTALVNRHLNLVYSAALRQVRSPQLAEEVSQTVFGSLARNAGKLDPDTNLTAWLYQVTRHAAIDAIRTEARRQAREQIAFQMSEMNDTPPDWTRIEPLLDEAMEALDETDRTAVLLRFFEKKSLREVGEALGSSEDAAQKRVSRAVDQLRDFFGKHKITVAASGVVALLSANAVQAAPAGLAISIATTAALALPAAAAPTAITVTKTIAMTTLQKTVIGALAAGAIAVGTYQAAQVSKLRQKVQVLEQQQEQQTALTNQLRQLQHERDQARTELAALSAEPAAPKKASNEVHEVLKLRGEVGRLRRENTEMGMTNGLSKATADPDARKLLRAQQKMGMGMIYKGFVKRAELTTDQTDKLNELLADHIMDNVDRVTTVLRDKPAPEQIDQVFAAQDVALQEKVQALLGPEAFAQYQDYTKNLLSTLTAEQFKGMMTGDDQAKAEKAKQMAELLQQETQAALANAGLPPDYQAVPALNFRNIASEQVSERSLKLLDTIYQGVADRGSTFLSAEELAKFQEFKTTAINNSRGAIALNRNLMAPISN